MNGIALHGGMYAACGTFFVFSDYMKPAIRISALMEQPVKYIFTHDAFRVGEDGPTHEPVEQEAQIRLLEQMNNLSGRPAALVLRPADAAETVACYRMAMENTESPSVMILSRQDIKDIPGDDRRQQAFGAVRGGYEVMTAENPDVVLVADGSEVSLLCDVAEVLKQEGIRARVVSMPSIGVFTRQDKAYRDSILPEGVPTFALTAGLPATFYPISRDNWRIFGLKRFGASAPYKVLDEKFGYTTENIASEVKQMIKK